MKDNAQHLFLFFLVAILIIFTTTAVGSGESAPAVDVRPGAASPRPVFVIPVEGQVEPGLAAFIKRALQDTAAAADAVIVLELDTFGGRVDAALQIVDTLLQVEHGRTIAFVKDKAISAGALIALACNDLVMRPHTTIGDCAPITYSQEGPQVLGEKFQSPLRAKFRTLARRNGYPPTLAEAMVTAEMEVYRLETAEKTFFLDAAAYEDLAPAEKAAVLSKKTVVAAGELLTMDDAEALDLGFSRMSAVDLDQMLAGFKIIDYELIRLEPSWSERLARFVISISPILLMIGLAALYIELKAPGLGIPGLVGIICLGLVFLNQYLVGLADYGELLLILLGLVLLGLELFVLPGFGLMGAAGLFCIGVGMILSFQDFVVPDPAQPWQKDLLISNIVKVLGSFVTAFVASLLFLRYVFPRLGTVLSGPYLADTLADFHAGSEAIAGLAAGAGGVTLTPLHPAGKAEIGKEWYDVITAGEFIEKGTRIKVLEIQGNRIIVERDSQVNG